MGCKQDYCIRGIVFGAFALLLQIVFFILYCVLVDYGSYYIPPWLFPYLNYSNFTNITCCDSLGNYEAGTLMVLLGLGLLFSVLRCTSFSSLGFVLFILAITVQWAGLVVPWLFQAALDIYQPQYIYMNVPIIADVIYCSFSMVVAYGAWVGRTSRIQTLVLLLFGVVLYAVNRMVVCYYLMASDIGGSFTVYMFGAFYGLAALFAILIKEKNWYCKFRCNLDPGYVINLFGFIGTLFLWALWPRFNAYLLPSGSDLQQRSVVNTYFSLLSATVVAYATSSFVTCRCKLNIFYLQMATIAGAIVAGSVAPLITQVWGAILYGSFVGFSVVVLLRYLSCFRYMRPDVLGVLWTFGFAGFVGGVASAIMAAIMWDTAQSYTYSELVLLYPAVVFPDAAIDSPRSAMVQGGYQMAGVVVSFGIAVVGGLIVGLLVRWIGPLENEEYFDDSVEWKVCCPQDCKPDCCAKNTGCEIPCIPQV